MIELIPSVKTSMWRSQDENAEAANEAYARLRYDVLIRDKFTCQACGFVSKPDRKKNIRDESYMASGYLEVHHIDDNHHNNKKENLITLCPFCHQIFTIGFVGHAKAGKVIWFPYLSQAEINILANLSYVRMMEDTNDASDAVTSDDATSFLIWLQAFASKAVDKFGDEITDPKNLSAALFQLYKKRPDLYAKRGKILEGLRLLPLGVPAHQKALEWWKDTHSWSPVNQWNNIYQSWLQG